MPVKKKFPYVGSELLDHMAEAVWVGDSRECTVYANPRFCSMVGYSLKEMAGRESYLFWDESSAQTVRKINLRDRKKGVSSSYFGNLLTKKGDRIPVSVNGAPLPDGGTIGIITDLSELRKKEQMERVLNNALEYATDGVIIFDREFRIVSWNTGANTIFGYTNNEILGKKVDRLFEKRDFAAIFANPSVLHNYEIRGFQRGGERLDISFSLTPFFEPVLDSRKRPADLEFSKAFSKKNSGSEGPPSFFLLICRDITAQKKFEEEMALKYEKIQEAYNRFGILRRQMDYIFDFLDLSTKRLDLQTVADFIVTSMIMLTRADACVLRRYRGSELQSSAQRSSDGLFDAAQNAPHRGHGKLELVSFFGMTADYEGKASIPFDGSLAQRAFLQKSPLKILDVAREPRYRSAHLAKQRGLLSALVIPLEFQGRFIGSLSLYVGPDKKSGVLENDFIQKYARLIDLVMEVLQLMQVREGREGQ